MVRFTGATTVLCVAYYCYSHQLSNDNNNKGGRNKWSAQAWTPHRLVLLPSSRRRSRTTTTKTTTTTTMTRPTATTTTTKSLSSIRRTWQQRQLLSSPYYYGRPSSTSSSLLSASSSSVNDPAAEHSSSPSSEEHPMVLYNSLTRSKDRFVPVDEGRVVNMYTCGPTVYDCAHVGNFRAFLTYDVMKRVLQYAGYTVKHVLNLTDVDDKIIDRCNEMDLDSCKELTEKYEAIFMKDLKALNCQTSRETNTIFPRATDYVTEMMQIISELATKDLAYETSDGSWYFATQEQPGYGKQLVQLNYDDMMQQQEQQASGGEDVGVKIEKRHWADFCLWKAFKPGQDRMDMAWEDEEGLGISLGRPGWHLECSAMARAHFGRDRTLDLHGGGIDLKFPHHENEIAQSEGVMNGSNVKFCNCWFHNGFVNIGKENEKMSKSLGNFITLQGACPSAADVRAYRYLVVSSQYRNPLAFTTEAMKAAKSAITRMDKVKQQLHDALVQEEEEEANNEPTTNNDDSALANVVVPAALRNFETAIYDDLSMPRAAAALFSLVKAAEQEFKRVAKQQQQQQDGNMQQRQQQQQQPLDLVGCRAILRAMERMDRVFGIFYQVPASWDDATTQSGAAAAKEGEGDATTSIPEEVRDLVHRRAAAKRDKDWELADELRSRIQDMGYAITDVKGEAEPVVTPVP